ncbi:MAG: hypothetical protein HKN25_04300 [Pyrinomonadaceae bacterium]|nr:hypothetical protein [Pyrinomonadaceae bacterium]
MYQKLATALIFVLSVSFLISCKENNSKETEIAPLSLRDVPAQRLNYNFEPDVPAPTTEEPEADQRNEAIQKHFDENRPMEILDRMITSPDKQRVLAVYRAADDIVSEFRLDMYSADGNLVKKITHDEMAVHFPDTIVWSPDSKNVAFIAMVRNGNREDAEKVSDEKPSEEKDVKKAFQEPEESPEPTKANANSESNSNTNTNPDVIDAVPPSEESVEASKNVLTFRTEQIYICSGDGLDLKPLTSKEGLMYFYFEWSPDSSMLVALASPFTEWKFRELQMAKLGERFVPAGRPRLLEKNGLERLLDDYPTSIHPAWSPDSAKVAVAYNKQVRIYDAIGERRTQAAIPLRNQLLLSSRAYDEKLKREEESNANSNTNSNTDGEDKETTSSSEIANANSVVNSAKKRTTLPDERSLVSYNPIVNLNWSQESLLYLQTGYVRTFIDNELENRRSYLRWHRLILSPQAIPLQTPAPE